MQDGYTDVPSGKIATIVTFLEMSERPDWIDNADMRGLHFAAQTTPDLDWYRDFFRQIGANWLWVSRLLMTDSELHKTLNEPNKKLFTVQLDGEDIGISELSHNPKGDVELSFFGIIGKHTGAGFGRAIMAQTLQKAWRDNPQKVHLQTCTLDHPAAIKFYQKCGFVPVKQVIQVLDDPRLTGLLPEEMAPHVPLIKPNNS
ncbi:MAG: GNAT family N-acetyltransferase [Hyphomicrobiales bacterium]|nr:MAG: GNAT family N-acetyltransferase [Hyphomicrobiales bacterium]